MYILSSSQPEAFDTRRVSYLVRRSSSSCTVPPRPSGKCSMTSIPNCKIPTCNAAKWGKRSHEGQQSSVVCFLLSCHEMKFTFVFPEQRYYCNFCKKIPLGLMLKLSRTCETKSRISKKCPARPSGSLVEMDPSKRKTTSARPPLHTSTANSLKQIMENG